MSKIITQLFLGEVLHNKWKRARHFSQAVKQKAKNQDLLLLGAIENNKIQRDLNDNNYNDLSTFHLSIQE